ncbi:putative MFS transporter [Pseudarthrobacter siccitolerans]|uniref:MFS transporter n=1 Tax=Pseudarthrobacter siccitolerans TaxID=861266 RepID=A0ABU0PL45_9MICC|nr:MFS transporter [Pseudarthrobacter siccitolerans]MDQ0674693.1 putative MFS transporter [Pseudarthrobacter siccitolerans]
MSQTEEVLDQTPDTGKKTVSQIIDALPRVGLTKWAAVALFCSFFFSNYEIAVFTLTIPGLRLGLGLTPGDFAWPVVWNLVGYAVGAYVFGYVADRRGRQWGLRLTFVTLGLGGLLSGLSWDVASLSFFRFLAGCGMGAVLAICSTYIGEMAPSNQRGRYQARFYLIQAPLLLLAGLLSLPLLAAMPDTAWRYLLSFGGLVLLVVPLINGKHLIESPRWLEEKERRNEALRVLSQLVAGAGAGPLPAGTELASEAKETSSVGPLRTLLASGYMPRLMVILGFWFVFFIGMYGFGSYQTMILEGLGISTSNALLVSVLGRAVPILAALGVFVVIERFERRSIIITGVIIFAASVLLMASGLGEWAATVGSLGTGVGVSLMASPAYTYTAEVFPTKVRGTASSICDGIGHLGGAVAPFIILPILQSFGASAACWAIIACLLLSAAIVRLGVKTKNRTLEQIAA